MFKHYFEGIRGIDIYPIFSLLVFFIFFVVMSIWIFKADRRLMEEMSNKPLESSGNNENPFTI